MKKELIKLEQQNKNIFHSKIEKLFEEHWKLSSFLSNRLSMKMDYIDDIKLYKSNQIINYLNQCGCENCLSLISKYNELSNI